MEGQSTGAASGSARTLTETEAKVLSVLLECGLDSEEAKIRQSGLPRTSYQDAKRRLYERGMVVDRYVPDPPRLGRPWATFSLRRPFAEDLESAGEKLTQDRSTVVAWRGQSSILSVQLRRTRPTPSVGAPNEGSGSLVVDLAGPTVPCYFDFEGVWKSLFQAPLSTSYPRPLGGQGPARELSGGARAVVQSLLSRPFGGGAAERAAHLAGPQSLPRSQRRLLASNAVQWRTFPRVTEVPCPPGRTFEDVVLIQGALQEGHLPIEPFRAMVGECGVYPFLYVTEGRRVLLGCLGAGRPTESITSGGTRGVLPALKVSLTGITVTREPLATLKVLVDHRYDLLGQEGS